MHVQIPNARLARIVAEYSPDLDGAKTSEFRGPESKYPGPFRQLGLCANPDCRIMMIARPDDPPTSTCWWCYQPVKRTKYNPIGFSYYSTSVQAIDGEHPIKIGASSSIIQRFIDNPGHQPVVYTLQDVVILPTRDLAFAFEYAQHRYWREHRLSVLLQPDYFYDIREKNTEKRKLGYTRKSDDQIAKLKAKLPKPRVPTVVHYNDCFHSVPSLVKFVDDVKAGVITDIPWILPPL